MKTIVKTKNGYDPSSFDYSISSHSDTVPDGNLSVREILMRFSRGLPPPGIGRSGDYDEDSSDVPESFMEVHPSVMQDFDLTDIDDLKDEYKSRSDDHSRSVFKNQIRRREKKSQEATKEDQGS